jgi:hypothetical protein
MVAVNAASRWQQSTLPRDGSSQRCLDGSSQRCLEMQARRLVTLPVPEERLAPLA